MNQEEKIEYEKAATFMRQAAQHIDKATDNQKQILLKLLLQHPPKMTAVDQAMEIWSALTEKEFMSLMAKLQKQFDPEFWTFSTRLR